MYQMFIWTIRIIFVSSINSWSYEKVCEKSKNYLFILSWISILGETSMTKHK